MFGFLFDISRYLKLLYDANDFCIILYAFCYWKELVQPALLFIINRKINITIYSKYF